MGGAGVYAVYHHRDIVHIYEGHQSGVDALGAPTHPGDDGGPVGGLQDGTLSIYPFLQDRLTSGLALVVVS